MFSWKQVYITNFIIWFMGSGYLYATEIPGSFADVEIGLTTIFAMLMVAAFGTAISGLVCVCLGKMVGLVEE